MYLCGTDSKESACNAGDPGSIPGLGGSPGEGNGYPFQYSCLENAMDEWLVSYSPQGCKELDTTERLTLSYEIAQGYSKIAYKNTEGTNVTKTALKKNKLGDFFYHISRFLYHYEVKTVWQCHKDRKWDLWRSLESPCIYVERHHCWPIRNEWSFQYMVLD